MVLCQVFSIVRGKNYILTDFRRNLASIWYLLHLVYQLPTLSEIALICWLFWCLITVLLDAFTALKVAQDEKDLEIIMLRQQVRILQRKVSSPRISKPEKLILTALTYQMKQTTAGFHNWLFHLKHNLAGLATISLPFVQNFAPQCFLSEYRFAS